MNRCLCIFAKEPREGFVKTRLEPHLGTKGCHLLYEAFLRDTLANAARIACEIQLLAYDAGSGAPRFLQRHSGTFRLFPQRGPDLGARMLHAFQIARERGADRTVLIGADLPNLPPSRIDQAFSALADHDIVLGPSEDGGYHLIGLRAPCPPLFSGIPWSSPDVLTATLESARQMKMSARLLAPWFDVDDMDGLAQLKSMLIRDPNTDIAPRTRRFLADFPIEEYQAKQAESPDTDKRRTR
jgi:rSAM/selenodomain-associated transferase 1